MDDYEKVTKAKLEYMEEHSKRLRFWRDENLKMRDDFAAENTYKFSNLIITLDVGIIGAMSFVVSSFDVLNLFSKILSLVLILPVISIILELRYRRWVIDVNRESADRRANFIADFMKNQAGPLMKKDQKTFAELTAVVEDMDRMEGEGFDEVNNWIKDEEGKGEKLRKWSLRLLIATLIGVIAIILSK